MRSWVPTPILPSPHRKKSDAGHSHARNVRSQEKLEKSVERVCLYEHLDFNPVLLIVEFYFLNSERTKLPSSLAICYSSQRKLIYLCSYKNLHMHVYSSLIWKSQNWYKILLNEKINCGTFLQRTTTQQQKRTIYWHIEQHEWTANSLC
jgi:hypothetical protein